MRKTKKLKILLISFFSLLLIGSTFSSCESEKDFTTEAGKSKLVVKRCSMKDVSLQSNLKLMQARSKLKNIQDQSLHTNATSKLVYDENSGLFYDDEKGIYVSKDGKESYNFPVIQTDPNEKIENITFNKNENNEYDIYIVKYDYTKEDLNNFSKEVLSQRQIVYYPLVKDGIVYTEFWRWMICVTTVTITASWTEFHEGFEYSCVSVSISTDCESGGEVGPPSGGGGGGGGSSGGDGGGYGGGGGGGGDGTNPGYTNPPPTNTSDNPVDGSILAAAVVDDDNQTNNPCQDLKSNTTDLQFRQKLNTLNKPVNFNKDHETAYIATKNGNVKGFTFLEASSGANSNHININAVPNAISYMHVHNDDYEYIDNNGELQIMYTAKIPSAADLIAFLSSMQVRALQQGIPANLTYGLTISSTGIYSFKLKVNDYTAITNIVNNSGIDWNKFQDDLDNKTKDILKENLPQQEEKAKTEKLMLQKLKECHLDQLVGLYEGTSMGSDLYAGVSWKEKYLDENDNLQSKPCN
jgi:hypothetical protein